MRHGIMTEGIDNVISVFEKQPVLQRRRDNNAKLKTLRQFLKDIT